MNCLQSVHCVGLGVWSLFVASLTIYEMDARKKYVGWPYGAAVVVVEPKWVVGKEQNLVFPREGFYKCKEASHRYST